MNEFDYKILADNKVMIICKDAEATKINIPNMIDGYDVVSVCSKLFGFNDSLESVTVPEGVQKIESYAFSMCVNLKEIYLPNSLKSIENHAFYGCDSLESIKIPEGVESIEALVFSGCSSLKEIYLPSSLKEIADNAFYQHQTNDSGPVFIVKKDTFAYEYAMKQVKRNTGKIRLSQDYIIKDHIMYDKDMKEVIYCPNDIDDLIDDYVASIIIPEGVETIGCSAFSGCKNLEEIHLPSSLKGIEAYAFAYCEGLETMTMPESVLNIGEGAFKECIHLEDVELPKGLRVINDNAFKDCFSLDRVYLPKNFNDIMFYDWSFDDDVKIYYDDTCNTYKYFYLNVWKKQG